MDLRDVFPRSREGSPLVVGRIKAAPDTDDDPVFVIVDDFDQRFEWGPYDWRPRGAGDVPSRGDVALLARVGSRTFLIDWYPRP